MLVSKPTYGGGAPFGIDLDAGVAKIRIPAKPAAEPTDETELADEAAPDDETELADEAAPDDEATTVG